MLEINHLRLAFKFREKAFKSANSTTISVTEKDREYWNRKIKMWTKKEDRVHSFPDRERYNNIRTIDAIPSLKGYTYLINPL